MLRLSGGCSSGFKKRQAAVALMSMQQPQLWAALAVQPQLFTGQKLWKQGVPRG